MAITCDICGRRISWWQFKDYKKDKLLCNKCFFKENENPEKKSEKEEVTEDSDKSSKKNHGDSKKCNPFVIGAGSMAGIFLVIVFFVWLIQPRFEITPVISYLDRSNNIREGYTTVRITPSQTPTTLTQQTSNQQEIQQVDTWQCSNGQVMSDLFECPEIKLLLTNPTRFDLFKIAASQIDCSDKANYNILKIGFQISQFCFEDGAFNCVNTITAYPSLDEYYFNGMPIDIINLGCTKVNLSNYQLDYSLYQYDAALSTKVVDVIDWCPSATIPELQELYPGDSAHAIVGFGESSFDKKTVMSKTPDNFTFKICLMSKQDFVEACDQTKFNIGYTIVTTTTTFPTTTSATTTTTVTQGTPKGDVWSKSSGYTVDDCYNVCEGTYDMEIQVAVCQGNCGMYGKPSSSLDKYVNTVKNIKN